MSGTTDLDFTGQTQSSVRTLFDFPARKYDPNAGRWTVPDPGAWSVVDKTNPQSFNRYAYVLNQPSRLTDPTGLDVCDTSFSGHVSFFSSCGMGFGYQPPSVTGITPAQLLGDINMQQYSAEFDHLASPEEAFDSFAKVVLINAANNTGSYTPAINTEDGNVALDLNLSSLNAMLATTMQGPGTIGSICRQMCKVAAKACLVNAELLKGSMDMVGSTSDISGGFLGGLIVGIANSSDTGKDAAIKACSNRLVSCISQSACQPGTSSGDPTNVGN